MAIFVCPLSELAENLATHKPARVISLLERARHFLNLARRTSADNCVFEFHDIHLPTLDQVMPAATHINRLLRFLKRWDPREKGE